MVLALLLAAATAAFVGLVIADNTGGGPDYTVTILGNDIATMNSLAVFAAGLGLALLFSFFVALFLRGGGARRRRQTLPPVDPRGTGR